MANSFRFVGVLSTCGYVQAEQPMLRQDQLAAIVSELEALVGRMVLQAVQSKVGNGNHNEKNFGITATKSLYFKIL